MVTKNNTEKQRRERQLKSDIQFKEQCIFYTKRYIDNSGSGLDQMLSKQLVRMETKLNELKKELRSSQTRKRRRTR